MRCAALQSGLTAVSLLLDDAPKSKRQCYWRFGNKLPVLRFTWGQTTPETIGQSKTARAVS